MNVLLTRPINAGGVSCCESVCAGINTKEIAKPMQNVLSAAMGMLWKAPSSDAPVHRQANAGPEGEELTRLAARKSRLSASRVFSVWARGRRMTSVEIMVAENTKLAESR